MKDTAILDKTFHFSVRRLVETGSAPPYTEVAAHLGCSMDDGRTIVHDLMAPEHGIGWIDPDTDRIASVSPFSNISTQYRIAVEGQQKWFGS